MERNVQILHPSILIVEDDEDDVFMLKEGFCEQDYSRFAFYGNALTTIVYLNSIDDEYLPKLIVTDFNLPAVNGFEFVKFLKNHTRFSSIPVVVLTTSMSAANKKLFEAEGVSKVILKPVVYDEYKEVASILKEMAE